jgi:hypothetical protein
MNAKDFPLVGGIIEGIEIYRSVTYRIVSERTRFVANLLPLDQNDLHLSMKYFEAGIVAGLLYLVPFFVAHDQSASKFVFILQQLVGIAIYTLFAYGAFRLLKVTQASFSKLITIMGFW